MSSGSVLKWTMIGTVAAAGFSAIATIFAAISVREVVEQTNALKTQTDIAAEENRLNTQVALIRYCWQDTKDEVKSGDDLLVIQGAEDAVIYHDNAARQDILDEFADSPAVKDFLRCDFENESRVPILRMQYWFRLGYDRGKTQDTQNSPVIAAIQPGSRKTVWIVNSSSDVADRTAFRIPERVRYVRFSDLADIRESLSPKLTDYWILQRGKEPMEALDQNY